MLLNSWEKTMTKYTKNQLELKSHIEKLNQDHMDKVRANTNPNIQYCTVPEVVPFSEIDKLAEFGITTIEDYKKDECVTWISEFGKSATGSRVRVNPNEHTLEELEEMEKYWAEQSNIAQEEERIATKRTVSEFAKRIKETCKLGANNYRTAIRWILEAEGIEKDEQYEGDSICFDLNLPFKYKKLFQLAGVA